MSPNMDARRERRLPETIRRIIEKKYANVHCSLMGHEGKRGG